MITLSPELLTNLADSEVEVLSWSVDQDLVLRVTKEIGPEVGLLRLIGVALVHLPPRFGIEAIAVHDRPFPDYPNLQLCEGESAVIFQESWGEVHVVVAEAVAYERIT